MTEVAVVVLNYNGRHLLDACLGSLARLATPIEAVVADNGSSDGSLEHLRQHHPQVRAIDLGGNLGFARGYNQALAQVDCPWLALLNNDATLAPDWAAALLDYARAHPHAGILGGKLLFAAQPGAAQPQAAHGPASPRPTLQCAGASFTNAGTAFEIGWGQADTGQFDRPREVGAVPGAAMLVRREVWRELGGFEGSYWAYLEDVDLCWRAWLRGHEVHYVPGAVAHHTFGASFGGRASPRRIYWMQRNRLANMLTHLQARSLPGALAVSLAYDAYRVLEYAGRGQFQALRALTGGTLAGWRALPALLARRRRVQAARVLSDRALRDRGLMVPALAAFREYRRLGRLAPGGPPA